MFCPAIAGEYIYCVGPGCTHCARETLLLDTEVTLSVLGCSAMMVQKDLWRSQ